MIRNIFVAAVVACATIVLTGGAASADESQDSRAGTQGHVTAWETDKTTPIDVDPCPRLNRYTWAYVTCGAKFRAKVNETLCRERGAGRHHWYYQAGNSKALFPYVARCD